MNASALADRLYGDSKFNKRQMMTAPPAPHPPVDFGAKLN